MVAIALVLAISGFGLGVVTICNAAHMPKNSPWSISFLVAGTFAASVGVVVTALSGDLPCSFRFACAAAVLLLGQVAWRLFHGLHPLDFIMSMRGHDANRQ